MSENPPRRVSNIEDLLQQLEAGAFESAEGTTGGETSEYGHLGPAIYAPCFRAGKLREWPMQTDFRPDNIEARD
jgi:hypothetical protein